jgi:hypothetical protein
VVGLGLRAGWVAPVGPGEPVGLDVGECAVPTGPGDVGEVAGWSGDGLGDVGEGLACRVVGVGVGFGDAGGVVFCDDPAEPSEDVDPVVVETGRTSR